MKKYFLILLLVLVFGPKTATAQAYFYRNLQQGDVGEDVRMLQQILNKDQFTQISSFGLCSPGQETNFFNVLTKVGVIRFQEKYAAEILAPIGLTEGTGYVGALTRQKLNSLLSGASSTKTSAFVSVPATTTGQATATRLGRPVITKIEPKEGKNGSVIKIYGGNFASTSNKILTSFGLFDNVGSPDGKTITFTFDSPVIRSIISPEEGSDEVSDRFRRVKMDALPVVMSVSNLGGLSEATSSFGLIIE